MITKEGLQLGQKLRFRLDQVGEDFQYHSLVRFLMHESINDNHSTPAEAVFPRRFGKAPLAFHQVKLYEKESNRS